MISAVIITYNEASKIEECIHSLSSVCDDILIIDAQSTDQTTTLAASLQARVITKSWEGYGAARNYGAQHAYHDWILAIDADERLSPELADNIARLTLEGKQIYTCNRLTRYCGRWIRHGVWHPEWKSKLYQRHSYQWDLRTVHESLISQGRHGQAIRLKGLLLHDAYHTHMELTDRLDKYARMTAAQWKKDKHAPWSMIRYLAPYYHFWKSYIIKMGFLDGHDGYQIARAMALYSKRKYEYYYQL